MTTFLVQGVGLYLVPEVSFRGTFKVDVSAPQSPKHPVVADVIAGLNLTGSEAKRQSPG